MGARYAEDLLLGAGMLLWVLSLALAWPATLSIGDEVGYIGQARLLLAGRIHPALGDPGIWFDTPHGLVAKYPLFLPFIIAPILALAPRAVFVIGVGAALALAWTTGRVLRSWACSPVWALVILAEPTVIILARTVMVDLLMSAFAIGAWWTSRRDRPFASSVLLALTAAAKPTGVPLAVLLWLGVALQEKRAGLDRRALIRVGTALAGIAAGLAATAAFNLLATGSIRSTYGSSDRYVNTPFVFWPTYFPRDAVIYGCALLAMPPLLVAGIWPFVKRREFGPLLVIGGFTLMMSFYFFVDETSSRLETFVLSPRLILPVVAFLLIGYASLLGDLFSRWRRVAPVAALVLPALIAFSISLRHRRWQDPGAAARAAAVKVLEARGERVLGVGPQADKAALLYDGPIATEAGDRHPGVVLCSTHSESYRAATQRASCSLPGYDDVMETNGFHILVRQPASAAAP